MAPNSLLLTKVSPNKNKAPCFENCKTVTKTELIHSKRFWTMGTFKIKIASKSWISKPLITRDQLMFLLFLLKTNAKIISDTRPRRPLSNLFVKDLFLENISGFLVKT